MKSVSRSGRNALTKFQNTADNQSDTDSKSATRRKRSHSGAGVKKSEKKKRKVSLRNKWFGIWARSTPHQLSLCISRLKKKQRQAVSEMGFGEMLTFNVDEIPAKLGHYVVDNFDVNKMEIKVANAKIKVNAESVHRLLGIPRDGIAVDSLTKTKILHPTVKSWRERYPIGGYISPTQIVKKITEDDDDDDGFNFKLDFLMLFLTTMVRCMTHGKCKDGILNYFTGDTDFSKIDWCSYVVDSMKDCKKLWRSDVKSPFTGPLCILTLLYVDSIECPGMKIDRGVKPIEFWTKDRLKYREDCEIKNGGFGVGEIIGSNEGFREEISKAGKLFEVLLQNKNKFENMFGLIYKKYPTNHEVLSMKMRYESMMEDNHQWTNPVNQDIDDTGNIFTAYECNGNVVGKNHDGGDCTGEREKIMDAGFHGNFILTKQGTFLTTESGEGQEMGENQQWSSEQIKCLLETFIEEVNTVGRKGLSLQKDSWIKLGKVLKEKFGLDLNKKQIKNAYDNLKFKYMGWAYLKNKFGNLYNAQTNTFNLTNEEWEEFKKEHPKAASLKTVPLHFPELCAKLFDGNTATRNGKWASTQRTSGVGSSCHRVNPLMITDIIIHDTKEDDVGSYDYHASEPTPDPNQEPNPNKRAKTTKSSSFTDNDLALDIRNALQYLIKGKEGPTVSECKEKLKLVGLDPVDPLFLVAFNIFGVSIQMREAWMELPENPEVLRGWIAMTATSLKVNKQ